MAEEMDADLEENEAESKDRGEQTEKRRCRQRRLLREEPTPAEGLHSADSQHPLVIKEEHCRSVVFKEQLKYTHIKEEEEEFSIQDLQLDSTAVMMSIKREDCPGSKVLSKSLTQEMQDNCGRMEQASQSYPCRLLDADGHAGKSPEAEDGEDEQETDSKSLYFTTNKHSCSDCDRRLFSGDILRVEELQRSQEEDTDIIAVIVKVEEDEERPGSTRFLQTPILDDRNNYRRSKTASNVSQNEQSHSSTQAEISSETENSDDFKDSVPENHTIFKIKYNCTEPTYNTSHEVSCSKSDKQSSLKEREKIHTGEKSCSCMDCDQLFIRNSYIKLLETNYLEERQFVGSQYCKRIVKKRTRKRKGTNSSGKKSFNCSECGKNFTQKSSLRTHKKIHTGEKPFCCSDCGRRFIRKSDLKRHGTTHPGEKPFCCSVCGKRFTLRSDLKRHGSSHPGDKPFSCSECGKGFTLMSSLRSHERIHTGEKPFSCSVCGKGFTLKSDLKRHEIIHTGEKPFSCSECGKRFTQKSSLKTHEKIHSGENPFGCSVCGKRFIERSYLRRHEKTHAGAKTLISH